MKDPAPQIRVEPARAEKQLTSLAAIDTREAARRSGWIAETARRDRPVTFNSAV